MLDHVLRTDAGGVATPLRSHRARVSPALLLARLASDLALVLAAFWLAYLVRYQLQLGGSLAPATVVDGVVIPGDYRPFASFLPVMLAFATILVAVLAARGLYRLPRWTTFLDEAFLICGGAALGLSAIIVLVFYARQFYFSRLIFLYALALALAFLLASRLVRRLVVAGMHARGRWADRVLVVGAGQAGGRVMSALLSQPELGCTLAGYVADDLPPADWAVATPRAVVRPPRLGTCRELSDILARTPVDEVIIALPTTAHDRLYAAIEQCRAAAIPFTLVPDLFELSLDRIEIHALNGLPLISIKDGGLHGPNLALKRGFDLAVAGAALLVAAIPMLLIALAIRLDSPGTALYSQIRIGRDGRPFRCFKFRSMRRDADRDLAALAASADYTGDPVAFKLKDDPRVTRVGRWLRKTSLDELPNLLNVLRGEMSIVGPRPHIADQVARYEPWHRQRLAITPGLTCLWQVNGRSDVSFDEQVRFDLYYAERWSLWLDVKIILWTIPAVLASRGAY